MLQITFGLFVDIPKTKFFGIGAYINPQFQNRTIGYWEVSYTPFTMGLVGFTTGTQILFGNIYASEISSSDTQLYYLPGFQVFIGPAIGKKFFYIAPTLSITYFNPRSIKVIKPTFGDTLNYGPTLSSSVGVKIGLLYKEHFSLITAYFGYGQYVIKRYNNNNWIRNQDSLLRNFYFSIAINPLFFTSTYPFREWDEETYTRYYHGDIVEKAEERNFVLFSIYTQRMFEEKSHFDYIYELGLYRYFPLRKYGNEFTLGLRRTTYNPLNPTYNLPTFIYFKFRPYFGTKNYDIGPYFSFGYATDGKFLRGGGYDFGLAIRWQIFYLDVGMTKAYSGLFYDPMKTYILRSKPDTNLFSEYRIYPSKLLLKVSFGLRILYNHSDYVIAPFIFNPASERTFLLWTLSLGTNFQASNELKIVPFDFIFFKYMKNKPIGFGIGMDFENITFSLRRDTTLPKDIKEAVKESRLSFKLGPSLGGRVASIMPYGFVGTAFYPRDLIYGGGVKVGFGSWGKAWNMPFYVLSVDLRYANDYYFNGSEYVQNFGFSLKFGLSYHIPIWIFTKKTESDIYKPVKPDYIRGY
ncbi:MAG: hypothetical protein N2504_00430 [candidate division WOR-3 bacterium]|nr:hypothetical protein [candidate division WOR-3 bacterium]MCX7947041.1 hypothetical protein [candidate division WOR-3 bacterium]MDW8149918.1 hypothetical protein [candidate division WOR-3 bacterium]